MLRVQGLIYKVALYKDFSKIISVYTLEGKKTLIAKGSQIITNPYRILTEYLNLIEFENKPNVLFLVLNKVVLLNDFSNIKKSYKNIKKASLILELIEKTITDNDKHFVIFGEILKALQFLETGYLSFALRLLNFLGYRIDFKNNFYNIKGISINPGRIINNQDQKRIDLNVDQTQELFDLCSSYQTQKIKDKNSILNFIYNYYDYHLDIKLKNLY